MAETDLLRLRKLAGFQKRFFWFGTDAVEVKSLSNYLRGEKPEVGNHNAAWSSQTGKGLLYFSKQAGEKSAPVGLINLVSFIFTSCAIYAWNFRTNIDL